MRSKSLIYGVGNNDTDLKTKTKDPNGKEIKNVYYRYWHDMLRRAYDPGYSKIYPTYEGVTVCDEWLKLSNFITWMNQFDFTGKNLDKDLINPNNKIYSPENCCFITAKLNSFLTSRKVIDENNKLPNGVHWHKMHEKFQAQITVDGKRAHLGYFTDVNDAEIRYLTEKIKLLKELQLELEGTDDSIRIIAGLERWKDEVFQVRLNELLNRELQ